MCSSLEITRWIENTTYAIANSAHDAFKTAAGHVEHLRKEFDTHCQIPQSVKDIFQELTADATEVAAAVKDIFQQLTADATEVAAAVTGHALKAADKVFEAIDTGAYIARSIRKEIDTKIDETLDPKIAAIAKNILSGLPVALLLLTVPAPLPLILTTGYIVVKLVGEVSLDTQDAIDAGIGVRHFAKAAESVALGIIQQNPAHAIAALVHTVFGLLWIMPNVPAQREVRAT